MKPTPFCCDITSGTEQERNEFKRLFDLASNKNWQYGTIYYGIDKDGVFDCGREINYVINFMLRIIPLSEGILILKEMVGEEEIKQPTDLKVVRDRIVEVVHRSLIYKNDYDPYAKIQGINLDQLEQRIDGILNSLQPNP